MILGAEAHALKAMLFYPVAQPLRDLGVFGVDQPVRHEPVRVLVERIADVGVVPAVEARVNQHRVPQSIIAHVLDLVLDGCVDVRLGLRVLRVMKGKLGIEGPHFKMSVDDDPLRSCRQAGSSLGQKTAASQGMIGKVHSRLFSIPQNGYEGTAVKGSG